MLKYFVILLCVGACYSTLIAQQSIQVLQFEEQLKLNTSELKDAELIRAETTCAGELSITHADKKFSGGCAGVIERTYTLSDACGNTLEKIQYISLEDNTPPVFLGEPEPEVTLGSRLEFSKAEDLIAIDETGEYASITLDEHYDFEGQDFVFVYRTWTARDACDNETTISQKISIPRQQAENK